MDLHILWSFNVNWGLGVNAGGKGPGCGAPSAWRCWWIYYKNNPCLGMFQMKFCLKIFETCSIIIERVLLNVTGGEGDIICHC